MATEKVELHSENSGIRRATGVTKFHDAGYYGERVKMGTGEDWDINKYNPDDLVQIPFGNGDGWGNFSGGHGSKTAATFFQVAPKSQLYQLSKVFGARTGKNCYCGFEDYCLEVIEKENLLGMFCSFDQICDKYLSEKYTTLLDQLGTFKYVVSAGNEYGEDYNELMECESIFGIGACYVSGSSFKPESFTSRCEYVDFSAPDRQTTKFAGKADTVIEYGKNSGTSFSAPWFLGQIALLDDYFIDKTGKPLSYKAVFEFVKDNVTDIDEEGFDTTSGHGVFVLPEPSSIVLENYQDQTTDTPLTPPEEDTEDTEIKYPAIYRVVSDNTSYDLGTYVCVTVGGDPFMTVVGPATKIDGYWTAMDDGLESIIHADCLEYVCRFIGEIIPKDEWPSPDIPDMSTYAEFDHFRYSSGVTVDVIPHASIKKLDFMKCNDPKETISSLYSRLSDKPQIIINGGLFNMSSGINIMSFIDEGKEQNYQNNFEGMGIKSNDVTTLVHGVDKDGDWKDFMSAYPMLVREGKAVETYDKATELDYAAARQAIGVKADGSLIIVTVDQVGAMRFDDLAKIFVDYGAYYAMNLDGGGSVYKMIGGQVANDPSENRAVDNAFLVYLNNADVKIELPAIYQVAVSSQLRIRSEPNTDSETLGYMNNGRRIIVSDFPATGWARMSTNIDLSEGEEPIEGYCSADWIVYIGPYEEETPEEPDTPDVEVPTYVTPGIYKNSSSEQLRVRCMPNSSADTIGYVQPGDEVFVYATDVGWAKIAFEFKNDIVDTIYGFCMMEYLEFVRTPDEDDDPNKPDEPETPVEPEEPDEGEDEPEEETPAGPDIVEYGVYEIVTDEAGIPVYDPYTEEVCGSVDDGERVVVVGITYDDNGKPESITVIAELDDNSGSYMMAMMKLNGSFNLDPVDANTIGDNFAIDFPTSVYIVDKACATAYTYNSDDGSYTPLTKYPIGEFLYQTGETDITNNMICLTQNIASGTEMYFNLDDVIKIGGVFDEDMFGNSEDRSTPGIFVVVASTDDRLNGLLEGDAVYVTSIKSGEATIAGDVNFGTNGWIEVDHYDEPITVYADCLLFVTDYEEPADTKPEEPENPDEGETTPEIPSEGNINDFDKTYLYEVTAEDGAIASLGEVTKVLPKGAIFGSRKYADLDNGRVLMIDLLNMDSVPEGTNPEEYMGLWVWRDDCEFYEVLDDLPDMIDTYDDLTDLNDEERAAVEKVVNAGIMIGRTSTEFAPLSDMTRVEVAMALSRLIEYLEGK